MIQNCIRGTEKTAWKRKKVDRQMGCATMRTECLALWRDGSLRLCTLIEYVITFKFNEINCCYRKELTLKIVNVWPRVCVSIIVIVVVVVVVVVVVILLMILRPPSSHYRDQNYRQVAAAQVLSNSKQVAGQIRNPTCHLMPQPIMPHCPMFLHL
jgi:hypothetical protein